jgi:formyltetrahydrofolate-dependent phosphoribosylglycinamide formyltransferase
MNARLVVLVSGTGTNLQALIDASADPAYGADVVAVGADRGGIAALDRAAAAGIPAFTRKVGDYPTRAAWDGALTQACEEYQPDLIVCAGFMKLVGKEFLARFAGRCLNTHPALLPSFPGMHGVRDALDYGVKVTGCTVSTRASTRARCWPRRPWRCATTTTRRRCTSGSRSPSARCSSARWAGWPARAGPSTTTGR